MYLVESESARPFSAFSGKIAKSLIFDPPRLASFAGVTVRCLQRQTKTEMLPSSVTMLLKASLSSPNMFSPARRVSPMPPSFHLMSIRPGEQPTCLDICKFEFADCPVLPAALSDAFSFIFVALSLAEIRAWHHRSRSPLSIKRYFPLQEVLGEVVAGLGSKFEAEFCS